MTPRPPVRLVLPHQLFEQQWVGAGKDTIFVLIEHDLYFRQYSFHSHKLVLHRASMAGFARRLGALGHEVVVLHSDGFQSSRDQLADVIRRWRPRTVTWFDVVDDWLEQDLVAGLANGGYTMRSEDVLETPNFLTSRDQITQWFAANRPRLHDFYVWQRRRLGILVEKGAPVGGKWSFDADNRKRLPRSYTPPAVGRFGDHQALQGQGMFDLDAPANPAEPQDPRDSDAAREVESAIHWVAEEFPDAPGDPRLFAWPTTQEEAREHLAEFVFDRLDDAPIVVKLGMALRW